METQNTSNVGAATATMNASNEMDISPNAVAAVSYVFPIVGVVALIAKPYNQHPTIRFHAWQAILASVASSAGFLALYIVTAILGLILGKIFGLLGLGTVVALAAFVVSIGFGCLGLAILAGWAFCVFQAATGKRFMIPLIGKHAERLASQG